jgi:hypothetical protein
MKVILELNDEQAYTLMETLELYSRIKMGQLDWVGYTLSLDIYDESLHRQKYDQELVKSYLDQAKRTIFPQLSPSAYIGIMGTGERSKISWDIYTQLRYEMAHFKNPNESLETRVYKPLKVSKEPIPKITITGE